MIGIIRTTIPFEEIKRTLQFVLWNVLLPMDIILLLLISCTSFII